MGFDESQPGALPCIFHGISETFIVKNQALVTLPRKRQWRHAIQGPRETHDQGHDRTVEPRGRTAQALRAG